MWMSSCYPHGEEIPFAEFELTDQALGWIENTGCVLIHRGLERQGAFKVVCIFSSLAQGGNRKKWEVGVEKQTGARSWDHGIL